ncbi:TPA: 30S ribosomal protein S3ae [Candidatus Bathyarchaeota archaeon]|nr:30S ribosomal protein S3ae [Candidatus Bathyarchaeota archaeon]
MSRRRRRRKKIRDKWRSKSWYSIYLPPYLGEGKIAETLADDAAKLVGRTIDVSLSELTGDITQDYVTLRLQITGVDGDKASTNFKGHYFTRDFLRVKVRRRRTLIDGVYDVTTKDNSRLRVTVMVITTRKITAAKGNAVRRTVRDYLERKAKELDYAQLVGEIVSGKVASELVPLVRKISPIEFVGVVKSKLLERVAG